MRQFPKVLRGKFVTIKISRNTVERFKGMSRLTMRGFSCGKPLRVWCFRNMTNRLSLKRKWKWWNYGLVSQILASENITSFSILFMHAKSKRDSLSCMKMKIRESTGILSLSLNNFLCSMLTYSLYLISLVVVMVIYTIASKPYRSYPIFHGW